MRRWTRFPDGTLIQAGRISQSAAMQTAIGGNHPNLFRTANSLAESFEVPFIGAPFVTVTPRAQVNFAYMDGAPTATGFRVWPLGMVSAAASNRIIDYVAIGRWR